MGNKVESAFGGKNLFPTTKVGKISLGLILLMPILFFSASTFSTTLYKGVEAQGTIAADLMARPLLSAFMLLGIVAGIIAFIFALYAYFKKGERARLIYLPLSVGLLLIIILVGELFPH